LKQRQAGPASESERMDRELHVGVRLLPRIRVVVEDVDLPVTDLQEVDVARYDVALEVHVESAAAVVRNLVSPEIDRNFHCHRHGIVDQHEPLQGPVALPVIEHRRQHQGRDSAAPLAPPSRQIGYSVSGISQLRP